MCKFCTDNPQEIRELGKVFGYPECCIEEFIQDVKIIRETGEDPRNSDQILIAMITNGYVPCKKHAALLTECITTHVDMKTSWFPRD